MLPSDLPMNAFELNTLRKLDLIESQILGLLSSLGDLRRDVLAEITATNPKQESQPLVAIDLPAPLDQPTVQLQELPRHEAETETESAYDPVDLSSLNVQFIPKFSELPTVNIDRRVSNFDRELVIKRCRFKAVCIEALTKPGRIDSDIAALHAEGKDYYGGVYWMLHFPNFDKLNDDALPQAAQAYRNLATALELTDESSDDLGQYQLVAEAQSALRMAVSTSLANWKDNEDQHATFDWLHEVCRERSIYLERYMKMSDTANPANGAELAARLAQARSSHRTEGNRDKTNRKLWSKLDYELKKLPDEPERWDNVSRVVGELLESGFPPSRLEFRARLESWIELDHPETEPLLKVFSSIAAYQEQQAEETEDTGKARWSADVVKVQRWLSHGRMVLVGGDCRDYTKHKLEEAFDLRELCWPILEAHDRIEKAYPLIDLPDVRLCLLAIRLSSHSYGPDLARYCSERSIPLVRLKAGLNPNRVAAEIIRQASARLSIVEAA